MSHLEQFRRNGDMCDVVLEEKVGHLTGTGKQCHSCIVSVRDACVAAGQVDAKVFRDADQPSAIMSHLEQFRRNGDMCDVVLEVDGKSLAAHRFVLAASIPYFRAMFGYDVVEAKMDRIQLNVGSSDIINFMG
ncbi:unnamed protein product [Nippostrongylus brasiliensis]|uniref:BTB domain-containing protein n=1 Tax=Nippostrongylus brasiliensis TaxID=27835 RepID=A0A0N4YYW0_NIPBR|nr:unnamed protein product [Nippostrongylus brasiliensis]